MSTDENQRISAKRKVLLDTDIGSDIDDAVALAYLLANPACDLLGITTVAHEAEKRAMLASVLCKVARREVPIFPGADDPLIAPSTRYPPNQAAQLANWDHQKSFPRGQAVEFLRSAIRRHPGEIDLLTIGPLTNVALLFSADPEIPRLLRRLVMMCGCFLGQSGKPVCEFNASQDPHATAMVYRHPVAIHHSVGLDVTRRVKMKSKDVAGRFTHPLLKPVLDMASVWFQKRDDITFHDPLAAALVFEPDLCAFERGKVEVEFVDEPLKGITRWIPQADGPHEVAVQVDAERFFHAYFSAFETSCLNSRHEPDRRNPQRQTHRGG